MKAFALLLSMFLTFGSVLASEQTFEKELELASGKTVSVHNTNGEITVHGWDQNKVRLVAVKSIRGNKELLDNWEVRVTETTNGVDIKAEPLKKISWGKGVTITMELWVPKETNMTVSNTNGDVVVSTVQGTMNLETTNGDVSCGGLIGTIAASTTNGNVQVELLRHDGQPLACHTTNGSIEIKVAKDLKAEIHGKTTNGEVTSELELTVKKSSKNRLDGSANGGGPEFKFTTTNGSIEIKTI